MSERKSLAGHIDDAIAHARADDTPVEKLSGYIADYLFDHYNPIGVARMHNDAYKILKNGVERALDVRDPSGAPLREYQFSHQGFMKELQSHLLNAISDSDLCLP